MADIPAGAIPVSEFEAASAPPPGAIPVSQFEVAPPPPGAIPVSQFESADQAYGGIGGTLKAGLQGGLKGLIGPGAPIVEKLAGVPYSTQRGLEAAHPIASGIGEAGTLVGGAMAGTGEAALLNKIGHGVSEVLGLGDAASTVGKIGSEAVNQAAQMALFQSGDNVTKMLRHDPDAAAETALSHVGLAAGVGGLTGAALGSISPIWKATIGNKLAPVLEDMKARFNYRVNNPDIPSAVTNEIQSLVHNTDNAVTKLYSAGENGGIKAEQIAKAMPEVTPKSTANIDEQLQNVSNKMESTLQSMAKDVKVRSKVPYIQQDLEQFQAVVTNPEATFADKFNALDGLKKTMQGYSRYGASVDDTVFGAITKKMAAEIRPALEDTKVWGNAAKIQADVNKAISEHIPAQNDLLSKFTTKVGGERIVDPAKVNTYLNQLGKPQAEIKKEMVKNALDSSEKLISTINDIFTAQGLEAPLAHTSTNALKETLGKKTVGSKLADQLIDKQLDKLLGQGIGTSMGGAAGHMLGSGGIGALIGQHALGPFFTSIMPGFTKNILESPTSVRGLKSAMDYGVAVAKGEKTLSKAAESVFKPGTQIISARSMPTESARAALDKLVSKNQDDPRHLTNANHGNLADYGSDHQTSLTAASTRALQYLQTLKPREFRSSPLDAPIKPSTMEEARYNRALDIAHQPTTVLQRIKDGTLQTSDIQDLNAMYPQLYKQMSNKLLESLTAKQAQDHQVPYRTKVAMSLFLGQPLETSMQPMSIMAAQPQPTQQPQQNQPMKNRKGTSSLGKSTSSYRTPIQAAQADRESRD